MNKKYLLVIVGAIILFSLLDHFFFVSEYIEKSLQTILLITGVVLIVSGAADIGKKRSGDPSEWKSGLLQILAGGAVISPGAVTSLAVGAVVLGIYWIGQKASR